MPHKADAPSPSSGKTGLDDFLLQFGDTERAWAWLDGVPQLDEVARQEALTKAVGVGGLSSAVLVRASALLDSFGLHDQARATLERALALDGPTAPAQIAYARLMHAAGEVVMARSWYRGGLMRARPDMALMLEYAAFEVEAGPAEWATRIAVAARGLASGSAGDLIAVGQRLAALQRADLAGHAFAAAYRRGYRGDDLLRLIVSTVDGPAGSLSGPIDPAIPGGPTIRAAAASMLAHGKLAASSIYTSSVELAQAREASSSWIPFERLTGLLQERIARREPFSWIRLSDGEARFLMHVRPDVRGGLDDDDIQSIVDLIWSIWFGQPFNEADPARVREIGEALRTAIRQADLLGVSSAERLISDQQHRGYCAALEHYLQTLPARPDQLFTDVAFNIRLNETNPFFGQLLSGLNFIGVISPHPDLADRLCRLFDIASSMSFEIPGEGRLGGARERGNRGLHFPAVYDHLMTDLTVPFPGAVFLVAGGLLGKIYCDRIKALGGIALDIGALADAWVGINTRGAALDRSMLAVLPV